MALDRVSGQPTLSVLVTPPRAGLDARGEEQGARSPFATATTRASATLEEAQHTDASSAALDWERWSIDYGARWHREVVLPRMAPLHDAGQPLCAFSAKVSAALLDPRRGGDAIERMAHGMIATNFPRTEQCGLVTDVEFPAVAETRLELKPSAGKLDVRLVSTLKDGTEVGAAVPLTLRRAGAGLRVERAGDLELIFRGPARAACEGTLTIMAVDAVRSPARQR